MPSMVLLRSHWTISLRYHCTVQVINGVLADEDLFALVMGHCSVAERAQIMSVCRLWNGMIKRGWKSITLQDPQLAKQITWLKRISQDTVEVRCRLLARTGDQLAVSAIRWGFAFVSAGSLNMWVKVSSWCHLNAADGYTVLHIAFLQFEKHPAGARWPFCCVSIFNWPAVSSPQAG